MTSPQNGPESLDRHLLTGMMDIMTDHVFILRREGPRYRLVYCNQAMANFMHQRPADLCGRRLDEIVPDPELYQRIAGNYDRVLDAGHILRFEETTEGFEANQVRIFDTCLSPMPGTDGNALYICGISRDTTARREAELALQQANETLETQLAENRELHRQLEEEAIRDPLTNLFNRRYFLESLTRELSRAHRETYPVTLMMLDIDHFKELNDSHGHSVGDQVLVEVSQRLCAGMRKEDVVCRWGGEEFLIMMPGLSLADAHVRIMSWRRDHSPMAVQLPGLSLAISFSSGLATAPHHGTTTDDVINATDKALYEAKTNGRNQVRLYRQPA